MQAQIADKFSVINGMTWRGRHDPYELLSGNSSQRSGEIRAAEKWPVFGSVVSRLIGERSTTLPPYVNLNDIRTVPGTDDPEVPRYLGPDHGPFRPTGEGLANLRLTADVSLKRLEERKLLLNGFDQARRQVETSVSMQSVDDFQRRAFGFGFAIPEANQ